MKVLCTYCEMEGRPALIEEKEPLGDPMITHGICAEHRRQLYREMEVMRRKLAAPGSGQYGRLPVSLRAVGHTSEVSGGQLPGTVRTVGVGGVTMEFPVRVPPGSLLRVVIERQRGPLEVEGRVVWATVLPGGVLHGIAFLTPKDPEFAADLYMDEVRSRGVASGGPGQKGAGGRGPAIPEYQIQRRMPRVTLPSQPAGRTRATGTVRLLDLSLSGARVEHLQLLQPGSTCHLELPAVLGSRLLSAQVVWSRIVGTEPSPEGERLLRYHSGLMFPWVTPDQETILAHALEMAASGVSLEGGELLL